MGIFIKNIIKNGDEILIRELPELAGFGDKIKIIFGGQPAGFKVLGHFGVSDFFENLFGRKWRVTSQSIGQAHKVKRQDDVAEVKEYGFYHWIFKKAADFSASLLQGGSLSNARDGVK
jgi:hypothetical protein